MISKEKVLEKVFMGDHSTYAIELIDSLASYDYSKVEKKYYTKTELSLIVAEMTVLILSEIKEDHPLWFEYNRILTMVKNDEDYSLVILELTRLYVLCKLPIRDYHMQFLKNVYEIDSSYIMNGTYYDRYAKFEKGMRK